MSKDTMHWEPHGIVLAARGDPKVGNRSCTDKSLGCIQGGLEPMAARIDDQKPVLVTDGQDFAPVAGLAAPNAAGLLFEQASTPRLSPENMGSWIPSGVCTLRSVSSLMAEGTGAGTR